MRSIACRDNSSPSPNREPTALAAGVLTDEAVHGPRLAPTAHKNDHIDTSRDSKFEQTGENCDSTCFLCGDVFRFAPGLQPEPNSRGIKALWDCETHPMDVVASHRVARATSAISQRSSVSSIAVHSANCVDQVSRHAATGGGGTGWASPLV